MSSAQNFPDSIAISYKENYWDMEVRNLGTALISSFQY